ncbi:MAG: hypothetical protein O2871_01275 [bacterium]|nr:hypothetical protein [bacterium]
MFNKKSKLPKELTTITTLSKTLALIVFIVFPFIAFYYGFNYSNKLNNNSISYQNTNLITYDDKFISFKYSSNLYKWSFGRGISLDFIQLNSVPEDKLDLNDRVHISIDIQTLDYTEANNIEEKKNLLLETERKVPQLKYTVTNTQVDGIDALVYENSRDDYEKTVWLVKNNVKYIFTITIFASTSESTNQLKDQYIGNFEEIVNSVSLKDVDPIEVDQLGNHPD